MDAESARSSACVSGYNFPSLEAIIPFLEPTGSGPSTRWATRTARRLRCCVALGYPELAVSGRRYNSLVTVSPTGSVLSNYRKTHLYYTDESWASEGPDGFYVGTLGGRLGKVCMGICMDINPYKFVAPWGDYEFAKHVLREEVELCVCSMAWLDSPPSEGDDGEMGEEGAEAEESESGDDEVQHSSVLPDTKTLSYWIARFEPVLKRSTRHRLILTMANRCGKERGAEYAGSSTVMEIKDGAVRLWDVLGKAQEACLVVDTDSVRSFPRLRYSPLSVPPPFHKGLLSLPLRFPCDSRRSTPWRGRALPTLAERTAADPLCPSLSRTETPATSQKRNSASGS